MIKRIFKSIILLLVLSTFLNGDFLLYVEEDRNGGSATYCITDYYFKNQRLYFLQSDDDRYDNLRLSNYAKVSIEAGYIYDSENNICTVSNIDTSDFEATSELSMRYNNFSFLGIPLEYFNTLMALSGLIISGLFLYGLTRYI